MSLISNQFAPAGIRAHRAAIKVILGTDPAAATEFLETVPAGKLWHLKAVSVGLTTDGTGTVWPSLVIDDGTTSFFRAQSGTAAQSLSTTQRHTWATDLVQAGAAADVAKTGVLPTDLFLPAGYRVGSASVTLNGTDNFTAPALYVVEYDV
jgi:hypothetical protein